jgi:hypothetical protein
MKRKPSAPAFKSYIMNRPALIPPSWDELIPGDHVVRVVNRAIEQIDLAALLKQYKGGGSSSYVYQGQAQTLDQMFVNPAMMAYLTQFRIAHINSDFPADYPGDVARGTSDHDPNVATFHLFFNWSGFFSPVANPQSLNTVKAGQAVPVKFSLNGDNGLNIFAAGYPQSTMLACDTLISQDAIEETDTAGSSSLSYDPTTDTYNYVWKTDKGWAGTCRQLVVKLDDGTYHYADFNFTK